jgi:two-component system chemotaxis sensor kinase CheA
VASEFDKFWEQFQSEADEHLTTADRLIEEAHSRSLDEGQVGELFRGFHSLKGLARAMDLEGMEGLAHRAESLLGLVRDHGIELDADLVQGLAIAVGQLGQMLVQVTGNREDAPAPPELLAELDRLQSERGGHVAPVAAPETATSSGGSGDMMSLLAELMREFLPAIAQLAAPVVDGDAAGAGDAVTALRNAAEVMEMPELGEILAGLSTFAERASPETLDTRIDFLARLGQQAMLVAEVASIDAGADAFAAVLAPLLADSVRDQFEVLTVVVLPKEATAAATLLAAIGHRRGARLLALASEASAASSRGDVPASTALIYAIDAAVAAIAGLWADPLTVPDDLDEVATATHEAEIRAALHATPEDEAQGAEGDGRVAEIALPEAFVPVLSTENRQDLERAIAGEQLVYQIMIDVEAYEARGESGPLERLAELGQIITSRTVPQGERTWFEFLIVSPLLPAEMNQRVKALDPGQRWIKAVHMAGQASGSATGPAPSEASGQAPAPSPETTRPAPKPASADAGSASDAVLRVRGAAIDALMSAVGHARVEAAGLSQILAEDRRKLDAMTGLSRLREKLPAPLAAELGRHLEALKERDAELIAADARLATALSHLHADALDLRVVPVETVLAHLPRMARELAQRQGKAVRIRLKGRDVRIDKTVVQQLLDPLMHMMRNAVDHGIETPAARAAAGKSQTATIMLRARQRASEFRLEVSDDGRGIDAETIRAKAVQRGLVEEAESRSLSSDRIYRFIFAPGFSTAATVTETSGRGVGMDVVMHTVTRLGGRIDIKTELGAGTTFTLRLPLSAAVLPALLVDLAGQTFAIPERNIVAVEEIDGDRLRQAGGRRVLLRGNVALPLHALAGLLGIAQRVAKGGHAVVVASGSASIAVEVDRLLRRQELLLRDLHPALAALPGVGGAALLGDGSPILVLDVDALVELARTGARRREARAEAAS